MTASRSVARVVSNLSLIAVCISSQAVFASQWQTRIIGGELVAAGDPVAATTVAIIGKSMEDGKEGIYLCTGSIIADDTVVTAAHCVVGAIDEKVVLFFGTDLHEQDASQKAVVSNGIMYSKQYSPGIARDQHDIAVIHFDGGLPAGYQAAKLLPVDVALTADEDVLLAGFGVSDAASGSGSGVLRKTHVTMKDPAFGKTEIAVDQTHGKGSCEGDSGGPAFVDVGGTSYLFGLTNRGEESCAVTGIYTRINVYSRWIAKASEALRVRGPDLQPLAEQLGDVPTGAIAAN